MDSIFERYQKGTSFTNWSERLGYFFDAVAITDAEIKKAYLITLLDAAIFSELKLLVSNRDLKLVPYEEIVQRLRNRYDPWECGFIQRQKFYNRSQLPAESMQDFIYAIKLQAELCEFGNFKQTAIMDRIVFGVRDKVLQRRLLCENGLTLEATEKIVATWEMTGTSRTGSRPVKERLGVRTGDVYDNHTVGYRNDRTRDCSNSTCGFCGKLGHVTKRCFELKFLKEEGMVGVEAGMRTPTKVAAADKDDDDDYGWKRLKRFY